MTEAGFTTPSRTLRRALFAGATAALVLVALRLAYIDAFGIVGRLLGRSVTVPVSAAALAGVGYVHARGRQRRPVRQTAPRSTQDRAEPVA